MLKIFKTKTFWVNAIGLVLQIVNDQSGKIIPIDIAATIQVIANIVVRYLTKTPVSDK